MKTNNSFRYKSIINGFIKYQWWHKLQKYDEAEDELESTASEPAWFQ